jgi:hypothetical protein
MGGHRPVVVVLLLQADIVADLETIRPVHGQHRLAPPRRSRHLRQQRAVFAAARPDDPAGPRVVRRRPSAGGGAHVRADFFQRPGHVQRGLLRSRALQHGAGRGHLDDIGQHVAAGRNGDHLSARFFDRALKSGRVVALPVALGAEILDVRLRAALGQRTFAAVIAGVRVVRQSPGRLPPLARAAPQQRCLAGRFRGANRNGVGQGKNAVGDHEANSKQQKRAVHGGLLWFSVVP